MMFLFKLPPPVYWFGGALLVAFGGYAYVDTLNDNAARAEALLQSPPPSVSLAEFDPKRHANAAKEVVLTAVLDTNAAYQITRDKSILDREIWVAPLRLANSAESKTVSAAVYETQGELTAELVHSWTIRQTVQGPLVEIHGILRTVGGSRRESMEDAFRKSGLILSKDAVIIDPFLSPRDQELMPRDAEAFAAVFGVGGLAAFLYGLLRRAVRRRRA